jgi:FtsP/CotA-like multicopper oxidase with cupredoxin domain
MLAKYGLDSTAEAAGHEHAGHSMAPDQASPDAATDHAAMIGEGAPAVGGPHDLDSLLYPPPALPYKRGRVREYTLTAIDKDIEVAPGVFFPAWTYNGTVPGPVLRATEGDLLRVRLVNGGSHPHTIHVHGIHPP